MKRRIIYFCLLLLINQHAVAQTPTIDKNAMNTQTASKGGKPIQSLIDAKNSAAVKADRWNDRYVVTVALAAVVAFAVFFAQRKAISESRNLSKAQDELMAEKDRLAAIEITDAQTAANIARLETEKLKALVGWRDISPEQRERFKALAKDIPKGHININSVSGNSEAANFARQISSMLSESGFDVSEQFGAWMVFGGVPTGVTLKIKNNSFPPLYAGPLQDALIAIGIDAGGALDDLAGDSLILSVANKP